MRSTAVKRTRRTLTALLLVFVLSFTTVFAETEVQTEAPADGAVQTEASTEGGSSTDQNAEETKQDTTSAAQVTAQPAPKAAIIKKGKYYYYRYANGKIRKKKGFVTVDGKRYYVRKGGKIRTSKTFRIKKKYYRAGKDGVIKTGVYKWKGKLYYSNSKGVWRKKKGFVSWNGNLYYLKKGGKIIVNDAFSVNNLPYASDAYGRAARVEIPDGDGSPVVAVAKEQVGIMTGKTYWVWYYKTKFKDTDKTPWCGAFVAWCYNAAGLYDKITVAKKYGPLGYVPSYSRYADKYDRWVNKSEAKGGDIIVFGRNMHVGLVEGVVGNYIITIEGNAGPTALIGSKKPGAVVRNIYKINNKKIKGIIRPE